jgi:cobalamin biosynthesis protein CobD/CbiB
VLLLLFLGFVIGVFVFVLIIADLFAKASEPFKHGNLRLLGCFGLILRVVFVIGLSFNLNRTWNDFEYLHYVRWASVVLISFSFSSLGF